MRKHYFLMATLVFGLAACTNETLDPENSTDNSFSDQATSNSTLTTVNLSTFKSNANRVTYATGTRADEDLEPGELKLTTTIANPYDVFALNNNNDGGGRYLSATSVYHDETSGKYYITYHMQGNNYNTDVFNSIGGAIEVFSINEDGTLDLSDGGFTAANRDREDYDFNHIYFDKTSNRIIVVGHKWSVPESYQDAGAYTGENTSAIIGQFNPDLNTLTYEKIKTNLELRDSQGKLIDYKEAGDGNCVVRIYDQYYLATRKGIAVLNADDENLFQPVKNSDGTRYFINTPGSCKFVYDDPNDYTRMFFLYLSDNVSLEGVNNSAETESAAKVAQFKVSTGAGNVFNCMIDENTGTNLFEATAEYDIASYPSLFDMPNNISPIDGKNTICSFDNGEKFYAALGKGGLYYKHPMHYDSSAKAEGTLKFGNKPVNCVYAEQPSGESFHGGYVYVANGATLTILDRASLDADNNSVNVMAEYTLSAKDGIDENLASANYIDVQLGNSYNYSFTYNGQEYSGTIKERIITVAYGQAGVRIFRFLPKVSQAFIDYLNR